MQGERRRFRWLPAAIFAAFLYVAIGLVFGWPTNNPQAWRVMTWLAYGVVFATHIAYEHFGRRNPPGVIATHSAVGVVLGGIGLFVAGLI